MDKDLAPIYSIIQLIVWGVCIWIWDFETVFSFWWKYCKPLLYFFGAIIALGLIGWPISLLVERIRKRRSPVPSSADEENSSK